MINKLEKALSHIRLIIIGLGFLLSSPYASLAFQSQPVTDIVRALDWSPDGSILAIGGTISGEAGIHLFRDHSVIALFKTNDNVVSIEWSPDGKKIGTLVAGTPDTIQIWDVTSGDKLLTLPQERATTTLHIEWSLNGEYLAFVRQLTLTAWGKNISELTVNNAQQIQTFAWHPKKSQIFIAGADQFIRLWDISTNSIVHEQKTDAFIVSLVTSPDGTKLALGGSNGKVQVWDLASYDTLYTVQATKDAVWNLEWSLDGQTIAAVGSSYDITIWDANSGQLLDTIEKQTAGFLQAMAISPYGGRLAYSTNPYGAGGPALTQTVFDDYTEEILNGAVQIVVPAPSPEKLKSITQACKVESSLEQSLTEQIDTNNLPSFITEVSALTDEQILPGCKADLLAVANALIAKEQKSQ
ncbi:MAG: hypothetical protein LCI00_11000 [Chloroflexi bacterium]|nr:hypothetical protein [Chloroflexota bacterium]MCC6891883.1 hypothetical protein [Anaerolineae bacterium]